jgi:hypothetical protein
MYASYQSGLQSRSLPDEEGAAESQDPWDEPTHGYILAHWNQYMSAIITIQASRVAHTQLRRLCARRPMVTDARVGCCSYTLQRAFRRWREKCRHWGWPSAHNAYHWIHWIDVR